jgi:hypothetical protein
MSMTSRISGTSKLERTWALRMIAFQKVQDAERYFCGKGTGTSVFNPT